MTNPTPTTEERLREIEALIAKTANSGPHEWGYRDVTDGSFVSDNWPFQAGEALLTLAAALREAWAENDRKDKALQRILWMRPAGDVATATGTRAMVQRMEAIARAALNPKGEGE